MPNTPDWDRVRSRLADELVDVYGEASTSTMSALAQDAGVEYSTIARFLHYYNDPAQQTHRMHRSTVRDIAQCLGCSTNYLLFGVGAKQRGFWPRLAEPEEELKGYDPIEDVVSAIKTLRRLDHKTQMAISRSVIVSLLEAMFVDGAPPSEELHAALIKLDATLDREQQSAG